MPFSFLFTLLSFSNAMSDLNVGNLLHTPVLHAFSKFSTSVRGVQFIVGSEQLCLRGYNRQIYSWRFAMAFHEAAVIFSIVVGTGD